MMRTRLLALILLFALVAATAWMVARERAALHRAKRAYAALDFALTGTAQLGPDRPHAALASPGAAEHPRVSSLTDRVHACIASAGIEPPRRRELSGDHITVRATLTPLPLPLIGSLLSELARADLRVAELDLVGLPRSDQFTLTLRLTLP